MYVCSFYVQIVEVVIISGLPEHEVHLYLSEMFQVNPAQCNTGEHAYINTLVFYNNKTTEQKGWQ